MSSNGSNRLYIFVLVLNLVFPVLGYTFTTFGADIGGYEIDIDPDILAMAGITLVDAESHNLSYNGGWVYWTLINVSFRAQFMDDVRDPWWTIVGDGVGFQKQSSIGIAPDTWAVPYRVSVKSVATNEWTKLIANDTIIRDYDVDFNWSRFILGDGHEIYITPHDDHGNITRAVYDDAHINCTIAKTFDASTSYNFRKFLGWYLSIMVGANSWGLPSVFSWVLRILGALSVFAVVMLTKDLIRL